MNNQTKQEKLERKIYFQRCTQDEYQQKIDALTELEKNEFLVIDNTEDEYEDRNFCLCYTCDYFEYLGSSYLVNAQCNFYPAFSMPKEERDECHIVKRPLNEFYHLLIDQIFENALTRQKMAKLNREIYNLKHAK